ncbi:hypothetical protein niasHT_014304 [Heterodera trifolii]|uniref:Uncharacterized protein n=1 Tax=Heterodera trifolii TaxID=157864 RepID=A0ABD2L947_9BILA
MLGSASVEQLRIYEPLEFATKKVCLGNGQKQLTISAYYFDNNNINVEKTVFKNAKTWYYNDENKQCLSIFINELPAYRHQMIFFKKVEQSGEKPRAAKTFCGERGKRGRLCQRQNQLIAPPFPFSADPKGRTSRRSDGPQEWKTPAGKTDEAVRDGQRRRRAAEGGGENRPDQIPQTLHK